MMFPLYRQLLLVVPRPSHCDCNVKSASETSWEWHPGPPLLRVWALAALSPPGTICFAVLHRLFLSAWFWGPCPCAFSSLSPPYRILLPTASISIPASFPSLVCTHMCSHMYPMIRLCFPMAPEPSLTGLVTLYSIFCYSLKHGDHLVPHPPEASLEDLHPRQG